MKHKRKIPVMIVTYLYDDSTGKLRMLIRFIWMQLESGFVCFRFFQEENSIKSGGKFYEAENFSSCYWFNCIDWCLQPGSGAGKTIVKTKVIKEKIDVVPEGYIDTTSEEFINNYIDMRTVVDYESNNGLQIYCADGSGYYWER